MSYFNIWTFARWRPTLLQQWNNKKLEVPSPENKAKVASVQRHLFLTHHGATFTLESFKKPSNNLWDTLCEWIYKEISTRKPHIYRVHKPTQQSIVRWSKKEKRITGTSEQSPSCCVQDMFPIHPGVHWGPTYIPYPLHWTSVLLGCAYTCTSATSASLVLPLSDCTFQRPSTQQLKWESHPFREMKVREKSQEATRLIRLVSLKEEQKVLLLRFPLTSMLFHTQEAWRPPWPMSHISSGCGTASYGGWWHSVLGGVLSGRSPWQIKGGCWYLSRVSLILSGWKADKWTVAEMSQVESPRSESDSLHWSGIELRWFDTGDFPSLSGLR